ncbi:membrane-bound lytic murein transglycosylase D [Bryocella elongata]|uniref:Membrane-bound lytic murein transglycosylase D n=2 Tax=Bryocella elongata TaxID=863522 RepID=A0A1H5XPM4_9BACT|nr:membrane-bound lytic murein transglycosylase D [Bryocella elongata]
MVNLRQSPLWMRSLMALSGLPLLVLLAGCPDDSLPPPAAAGSMPIAATAPSTSRSTVYPSQPTPALQAAKPQTSKASGPSAQQTASQQPQQPASLPNAPATQQTSRKAQDLINRVETTYNSGVSNYNANHLDAARMDFDSAVDLMLSSGMDLKGDQQLADEFESLVSRINSLEMVALKEGNGFSPKVEPAPLDVALGEVTFGPPDPALLGKVNAELKTTQSDLPLVVNNYVAGFISYFSNSQAGHAHLVASLERAGKYKEMIQRILRENGVPQDLIYQAVAESGFQPQALNARSGAGGMWQFMPFAGAYNLERNGYFDERFDPEKSTVAYAKYMKGLYAQFGDWYLAMAAYDWGPGNVQRAVSRTGYADFWELLRHNAMPAETRAYVPGIIAAAIMAKNPQQYGLANITPMAPVLFDTVSTSYAIDLRLVADLTSASVSEIVALNPALLRMQTPRDIPYDLRLPPGSKQVFLERLKDIPEDNRASWRFHVVKAGETLDDIATNFHARATEISSVNEITAANPMATGDELVIPIHSSGSNGEQHYKARRGDTLVTIADHFGVTVEQLRSWNHMSTNTVAAGRTIFVAEPVRLAPSVRASRTKRGARTSVKASSRSSAHSPAHSAATKSSASNRKSAPSTKAGAKKTTKKK